MVRNVLVTVAAMLMVACASAPRVPTSAAKTMPTGERYIPDNTGPYLCPYTHDGVLADWIDKAVSAKAGGQLGKATLGATGGIVGEKYGGWLGGVLARTVGQKVGEAAARAATIKAIGGWEYIQETSDISFTSLSNMATFLRHNYHEHPHFKMAVELTGEIYPEFARRYARSLKEAAR